MTSMQHETRSYGPPLEHWTYWAKWPDQQILVSDGGRANPCNAVPLDPRLDLRNHSPSGFNWGFEGSGPAQAALAIVSHCTGDDELALRVYEHGLVLHKCTANHYQLAAASGRWLLNIYPGNCRLYNDPNHAELPPFLGLMTPWTLRQVVEATVAAMEGGR